MPSVRRLSLLESAPFLGVVDGCGRGGVRP